MFDPLPAHLLGTPAQGTVLSRLKGPQLGQVKVTGGVIFNARLCVPDAQCVLTPGAPVMVVGRRGNTLLVLPYQP